MTPEQLFYQLRQSTDPDKGKQMSAYMKHKFPFLGIQTPDRRSICKTFFAERQKEKQIDWQFVEQCWQQQEREFQYVAIDYLNKKKPCLTETNVAALKHLAQSKSWWDTIDGLDRLVGSISFNYPQVKQILLQWSLDDDFWLRRIAIDHQLLRKDKTDTELLEQILVNNLNQQEFFINKAIGWSLRDYSKTDPDWVAGFIERHRDELSALSIREGSKYL